MSNQVVSTFGKVLQSPSYGKPISLEVAKQMMSHVEKEAIRRGLSVVIAILDSGAHMILLERMDGAPMGSVDIALKKAESAVLFRNPTKIWNEAFKEGATHLAALPGLFVAAGGYPIVVDGELIGAIGVSGATAEEDHELANLGVQLIAGVSQ